MFTASIHNTRRLRWLLTPCSLRLLTKRRLPRGERRYSFPFVLSVDSFETTPYLPLTRSAGLRSGRIESYMTCIPQIVFSLTPTVPPVSHGSWNEYAVNILVAPSLIVPSGEYGDFHDHVPPINIFTCRCPDGTTRPVPTVIVHDRRPVPHHIPSHAGDDKDLCQQYSSLMIRCRFALSCV
jgi:hypothetical protein